MAYLGNSPGVASQRVETAFTATASQTVFTPSSGYTLGYCDVYYNGVKLVNGDDYTAADGVSITLATAAAAGDSVVVVASFPRGLSDGYLKAEADAKYVALTGDQTVAGVKTFSGSATIVNGNLGVGTSSVLGNSTFNAALGIAVRNQSTSMGYFQTYNANAGSNLKTWRWGGDSSGNLVFETVNDAYSSATTRLTLGATGGLTVTNTIALYNSNQIRFYNSNNTNWSVIDCPATDGTGPLRFSVGSGEAARFDNSGRFFVGSGFSGITNTGSLTNPTILASGSIEFNYDGVGGTQRHGRIMGNGTTGGGAYGGGIDLEYYAFDGSTYRWYTGARLDSSGNWLVNTTSATGRISVRGTNQDLVSAISTNGSTGYYYSASQSTGTAAYFVTTSGQAGLISLSGGSTTYGTSSDYRLKENIIPMVGALATVAQLKPCTYTWKFDGSSGQGFIAHELQEVVPDCVIGEKDAVNEDGSIKPQSIDTSFLVATLAAAIQEQQAIIEQLRADVQALKEAA